MKNLALLILFGVVAVSVNAQNYGNQIIPSRFLRNGGQQTNQQGQIQVPASQPNRPTIQQHHGQIQVQPGAETVQRQQYEQTRPTFEFKQEEPSLKTSSPCYGVLVGTTLPDTIEFKTNQYIHCEEEGKFKIRNCPPNLVFNPNTDRCENTLKTSKACLSSPCQNNGLCVDMPKFSFICQCPTGFTGELCERSDVCSLDSCGPDATCVILAPGAPVPKYCITPVERTLCALSDELRFFSSSVHPSLFIHCEGDNVHIKFCSDQLVFIQDKQICDWDASSSHLSSSSPSFSSSQYDNLYSLQHTMGMSNLSPSGGFSADLDIQTTMAVPHIGFSLPQFMPSLQQFDSSSFNTGNEADSSSFNTGNEADRSAPSNPIRGLAPSNPFGGSAPSKPFGGSAPSNPFGGSAPSNPIRGLAPSNPFGGSAPSNPFGGSAPSNPIRGPAPSNPFGGSAPSNPIRGPAPSNPFGGQARGNPSGRAVPSNTFSRV